MNETSAPARGHALHSMAALLLLAVMWGLSIPVTKLGLQSVPPLTLTALRFVVAVPLLLVLAIGKQPPPRHALPSIAALGALGISLGQVAQALGVKGTSAAVGTIISASIPVFVVVFAALRLRQPVTVRQRLGLLVAFVGIVLVALGNAPQPRATFASSLTGVAWLLISALAIAFYYVWSVELTDRFGAVAVATWSTLFGFVALLPMAAWEVWHTPLRLTAQVVWVALYLGVVVAVAGLFLWIYLLRSVPARIAASVQYLQPVVGIAAAAMLFGERLGALFVLGVLLILGGLALVVTTGHVSEAAVSQA